MTKQEIETIRNIVERLKKANLGCSNSNSLEALVSEANSKGVECASRLYVDTWLIGALECLLPEQRDPSLAVRLSR